MWRTLALISKSTAKLQKNIDVGKFWSRKVRRKWILKGKYEKTRSWMLRVRENQGSLPTLRSGEDFP